MLFKSDIGVLGLLKPRFLQVVYVKQAIGISFAIVGIQEASQQVHQ